MASETLFSKISRGMGAKEAVASEAVCPESPLTDDEFASAAPVPVTTCHSIAGRMLDLSTDCESKTDLIKAIAHLSRDVLEDAFLWYIESDSSAGPRALALTSTDQAALWQVVQEDAMRILGQPYQAGKVIRTKVQSNTSSVLMATMLPNGEQAEAVIAVVPDKPQSTRQVEAFLAEFAMSVQAFNARQHHQLFSQQSSFYQKLIHLSNIISTVESEEEAQICTVNFLREMLEARQVSLVTAAADGSGMKVGAISDVETFDRSSEICLTIRSLAGEAIKLGKSSTWRSGIEKSDLEGESQEIENEMVLQWKRRFCNLTSCDVATSIPFTISENTSAALIIAHRSEQTAQANQGVANTFAKLLANQFRLLGKSHRGAWKITRAYLLNTLKRKTARVILAVAGLLIAGLLIPMPYVVKSDCQLEPVERRFVAAPFDAVVDRSLVQNGDLVKANQLLARLDGRQLRIELSARQASLQSEQKKHDSALAARDIASSQIALLEVKRLKSEIQLIESRLKNLEIRSPIAGIVVSGDLEKVEGAPVEIGQKLYEIGPLDQMLVEVEIDEAEIRYVKPGQQVQVRFDSFPFEKFSGSIVRIHPRAEIRDDKSVFIADVEIPNDQEMLRPGMKGRCRIQSSWYPVGWNLFHRSYESVRGWLVW